MNEPIGVIDPETAQYLIDLHEGFNDDRRFAAESLVVANESGDLVPLIWRTAQERLDTAIKTQQRKGKPVRIIILKSRRAGFSTGVAAKLFKHTAFYPGQATLIVSHIKKASANLFGMYDRFVSSYKPFGATEDFGGIGLDEITSREKGAERGSLVFANRSSITIETAKNLEGSRSFGYRRIHLSEFAFYPDAKTLMTALMATVPRDPDTMVIIESTANGVGGEFYDQWMSATDPLKESDWLPLFFAWHEDASLVQPIDGDRGLFERGLTKDELQEQRQYGLTLEQLNWRRWCIANQFFGDERNFRQEFPGNPMEAFLTSGNPVFDPRLISRHTPMEGVIGELEHSEYNGQREMLFRPRERGALRLFKRPEKGRSYVIGVDTASGLDKNEGKGKLDTDYSVAQVFDLDTGEQVATFRFRLIESVFAESVWSLGAWYNWAYIVPEVQGGNGRAMLDRLIAAQTEPVSRPGYPMERIYSRRNEAIGTKPRYDDLGWGTNTLTKPQLVSALNGALYDNSLIIYDPMTLRELQIYVRNGIKTEAQSGTDNHDDTVIALALVVIGIMRAPRIQTQVNNPLAVGDKPSFWGMSIRKRLGM